VSTLAIGIPAFFLALAPSAGRAQPGFVRRVLNLSVPAGALAAAATLAGYSFARHQSDVTQAQARTAATIVLFSVSLWVLVILARPFTGWRLILVSVMGGSFLVDLAVPGLRRFYALDLPPAGVTVACLLVAAIASAALEIGWRVGSRLGS
jgi:cation-transporting ATPase E